MRTCSRIRNTWYALVSFNTPLEMQVLWGDLLNLLATLLSILHWRCHAHDTAFGASQRRFTFNTPLEMPVTAFAASVAKAMSFNTPLEMPVVDQPVELSHLGNAFNTPLEMPTYPTS